MSAFGGGGRSRSCRDYLFSLFNQGCFNDKLLPWAFLALVFLKALELPLQAKAKETFAAMVSPIVVLILVFHEIGMVFYEKY